MRLSLIALLGFGVLFCVWGVAVIADAVLRPHLGTDVLAGPTEVAVVLFGLGCLLGWLGYRRMSR